MPQNQLTSNLECPICGSSKVVRNITSNSFNIYNCRGCELLFTFPPPSEDFLIQYYQGFMYGDGRSGEKPTQAESKRSASKREKELLVLLDDMVGGYEGKTFLDYGGGTGSAFGAAREMGMKAYFFDLDAGAIKHVRDTFLVDSKYLLADLDAFDESFDVILCDNVIEHVRDPQALMSILYGKLRPGGRLLIKTPNAKNVEVFFRLAVFISYCRIVFRNGGIVKLIKSLRNPIWHCDPPRHLYSFGEKNLSIMAEKIGLDRQSLKYTYYESGFWQNSYAQNMARRFKRFSMDSLPFILLLLLASIPEFVLNLSRKIFVELGFFKPAGMALSIEKPEES